MRLIFILLIPLWAVAEPLKILIDPGHGGMDQGTIQRGVVESEITLKVSQHLSELLRKDSRFRVQMTRTKDEMVSLGERTRQAADQKVDLLLSIHVNSSPEVKARGAEFYFQNQLAPDEESMFLAHKESEGVEQGETRGYALVENTSGTPEVKAILSDLLDGDRILRSSQLSKFLKVHWQGYKKSKFNSIRQAPFYVLAQSRIPSALVELGFLTNPDDFRDLTDSAAQSRMAQNLYSGLIAYKESIDKKN